MKLYLHDATPTKPGEKHGARGPTHAGTVDVDYEYQAEMWVGDIASDYPQIVRIECLALGCEWVRERGSAFQRRTPARTGDTNGE